MHPQWLPPADSFAPVTLEQLNASAGLRERVDAKYVVSHAALEELLGRLQATHQVLEIDGHRSFEYRTTYFDSDTLATYREHVQRRRRRFKCRSRQYVQNGVCVFEVKMKGTRGRTVKHQMAYDPLLHGSLSPTALDFLRERLRDGYGRELDDRLAPALAMSYHRTTFADLERGERLTCDVGLHFEEPGGLAGALADGYAIVESKSARGRAIADRLLREVGARPASSCSKYCVGITLTRPDARGNRFLPLVRRYFERSSLPLPEVWGISSARDGSMPFRPHACGDP